MAGQFRYAILLAFAGISASQVSASPGFQAIADRLKNAINASVNPCDNFFEFACGGWKAANPVPPDATAHRGFLKTIYGLKRDHIKNQLYQHFDTVDPTNQNVPRTVRQAKLLLDGCQANATSTGWAKLVQLFDTYGGWPVLSHSWKQEHFETQWTLEGLAGHISSHYYQPRRRSSAFWRAVSDFPSSGSFFYKLIIKPNGYGGPPQFDKDYFIRIASEIGRDAGLSVPAQQIQHDADQVEQVAVRLASIYQDSNPTPSSIPITISDAQTRWPYINWMTYMTKFAEDTLPMHAVQRFRVQRPNYFDLLAQYYPTVDTRAAQNLLIYQIAVAAKYDTFNSPVEQATYQGEQTRDAEEMQLLPDPEPISEEAKTTSQKQHCQALIGRNVLPAKYLLFAMYHAPQWNLALPEAHRIVDGVLQTWQDMVQNTSWLQESGKRVAKQKVQSVNFTEFGFDPKLFDEDFMNHLFGGLEFEANNNGKVMAGLKFGRFKTWEKIQYILGLTYRKHNFGRPLTVNAFYSPSSNKIRLPAGGMLSDPYFEYGYPKATNYGGLGFTVGHEMGHGFDPHGVHRGPHGELSHWIDSSMAGFNQMETCMRDEYNHYCYTQDGQTKCINGERSAPDNTADNGGIVAAFRAYKARIAQDGPEPTLPGEMGRYSMEQIFFMSFGYTWCRNTNKHWFPTGWQNAAHATEDARVMVPDMNFEDFHKAFNCPVGSHMHPAQPCRVWH